MKIDVEIKWLKDFPDLHIQHGTEEPLSIDVYQLDDKSDLTDAIIEQLYLMYRKYFKSKDFKILDYDDIVKSLFH